MDRKIFLNGEIDEEMANNFLSQLMYLEKDSEAPITIYINSPGGEVNAGLLIYDAIQCSKLEINMICTGISASMAAIILTEAVRVLRGVYIIFSKVGNRSLYLFYYLCILELVPALVLVKLLNIL